MKPRPSFQCKVVRSADWPTLNFNGTVPLSCGLNEAMDMHACIATAFLNGSSAAAGTSACKAAEFNAVGHRSLFDRMLNGAGLW